jgi:hypothetical protein
MMKSMTVRWAGHVERMGTKGNAFRLLMGKPKGKRPLGRPRCRWVDNIKLDLGCIGWGGVDWIGLAQDRDTCENSCECDNEPLGPIQFWETIKWLHRWWPIEYCSGP